MLWNSHGAFPAWKRLFDGGVLLLRFLVKDRTICVFFWRQRVCKRQRKREKKKEKGDAAEKATVFHLTCGRSTTLNLNYKEITCV